MRRQTDQAADGVCRDSERSRRPVRSEGVGDAVLQLDRLHAAIRRQPAAYRVVLAVRALFAAAFVPTGMVKLLGQRFTLISTDNPIGALFEALYQAGPYWRFIGASQVLAGLLLLVPRTATLGALVTAPIVVNILAITVALRFTGTPLVAGAMLTGVGVLLAWDWHRLRGIVTSRPPPPSEAEWVRALDTWWERAAYVVGTIAGVTLLGTTRGLPRVLVLPSLVVALLAIAVAAIGWVRSLRRRR